MHEMQLRGWCLALLFVRTSNDGTLQLFTASLRLLLKRWCNGTGKRLRCQHISPPLEPPLQGNHLISPARQSVGLVLVPPTERRNRSILPETRRHGYGNRVPLAGLMSLAHPFDVTVGRSFKASLL